MRLTKLKISDVVWFAVEVLAVLIVLKYFIQIFCLASFKVPTSSMYPTIRPGCRVFVNKWAYGARLFDVTDTVRCGDICRMPGYADPERNDIVVFNDLYSKRPDSVAFHVLRYMVKRCIGLPGDTVSVVDGYYRVAGYEGELGYVEAQRSLARLTTDSTMMASYGIEFKTMPYVDSVGWNVRDFGPLYVLREGDTLVMDGLNRRLYGNVVAWEAHGDTTERVHVVKQNYYFVAGDNVAYSNDSRYWGLVPEEFVVGRVDFIKE